MDSSLCEKPERHASGRLSDHLVLEDRKQKVHSLVDKVYSRKNLSLAWERVRANHGASGTDGVTIEEFEAKLDENLDRLQKELREDTYQPRAVRRLEIPKRGAPSKTRPLGIPSVYDRVCQQALVNRLEPIFEGVFDPSSFGYRKGRKTADALTKIWREVENGNEWIVDADLEDFFDRIDRMWLLRFLRHRVGDERIIRLVRKWLKAGVLEEGEWSVSDMGTPQGSGASPRSPTSTCTTSSISGPSSGDGDKPTGMVIIVRYADDVIVGFEHEGDARRFRDAMRERLEQFGLELHGDKTRLLEFGRYASERR